MTRTRRTLTERCDGPLCAASALRTVVNHTLPGAEITDPVAGRHVRLLRLDGRSIRVTVQPMSTGVSVEHDGVGSDDPWVRGWVRWWFDLDADVAAIDRALAADPLLRGQVIERPGVRVTRYGSGFEAATMTVVGQQVSLAAARTFGGRLVDAYGGDPHRDLRPFPDPRRLAAEPLERLRATVGLTNARARTVRAVAALFADGFVLQPDTDPVAAQRELAALPGIGPWTVSYLAIRAMSDADAFPASDAVLRRALGGVSARAAEVRAAGWSPYRSYASMRVWAMGLGGDLAGP